LSRIYLCIICLCRNFHHYCSVKSTFYGMLYLARPILCEWKLIDIRSMLHISAATLTGCFTYGTYGVYFWTAGQRTEPSRNSTFIWKVKSSDTFTETLSLMKYTNWAAGQPDFHSQRQSCMIIWSGHSYTWDDNNCSAAYCSVCELDI